MCVRVRVLVLTGVRYNPYSVFFLLFLMMLSKYRAATLPRSSSFLYIIYLPFHLRSFSVSFFASSSFFIFPFSSSAGVDVFSCLADDIQLLTGVSVDFDGCRAIAAAAATVAA
eukprot:GHVU01116299.1.p1 GENE.GHVU01116299.1~~GHVU01116299.1.p1  ORF type:complete len:113 (-),score=13.28 GHVU01116299.1:540-878(-)